DALMDVLDPNVVGWTDGGGMPGVPREAIAGRERVAKRFMRFLEEYRVALVPMAVNGEPGVIAFSAGTLIGVIAFETRAGVITRIHSIANPQKLAYVASLLELPK